MKISFMVSINERETRLSRYGYMDSVERKIRKRIKDIKVLNIDFDGTGRSLMDDDRSEDWFLAIDLEADGESIAKGLNKLWGFEDEDIKEFEENVDF